MTCASCDRVLADGDIAYEQDYRTISVSGTAVTFGNETVLVCEACATPEDGTDA